MGVSHFAISGVVDLDGARSLAGRLHRHVGQTVGDVIVDCSAMTFIDSVGLRTLVEVSRGLAAQGRSLILTGLQPVCCRAIQSAGLASQFGITQDA